MGADRTSFRPDSDIPERLQRFQRRYGAETKTEAINTMIRVADRETRYPIVWRAKQQVVGWVNMLAVLAVATTLVGLVTPVLVVPVAIQLASVIIAIAAGLVGMLAAVRVALGQSPIVWRSAESGVTE